ncbi:MAG: DUF2127 domain-containing protein [Mycobacteriales bacterium]
MTTSEQPSPSPGPTDAGPPDRRVGRPTRIRYEILDCALVGHHLIGRDVRTVRAEDAVVVREYDGLRWHRCLRCDAWVPLAPPDDAEHEMLPARDRIEIPLRGRALRDRYVLRLIAIDRVIHVVLFLAVAIGILIVAAHRDSVRRHFADVVTAIWGNAARGGGHGVLHSAGELLSLQRGSMYAVAGLVLLYAALEGTEAVGLWYAKRWAEYLTFLATILLLPLEIYELTRTVSALKVITLIINVAIAVYLLFTKRLFGLRGGGRVDEQEREFDSGWQAIDRAAPPAPARTSPASPRD